MSFTPSLLTAAFAGAFSAIALPLLHRWMGPEAGISIPYIMALVVTVALPAKTFVMGPKPEEPAASRTLDIGLIQRIGAWLLAAALVTGLRWLFFGL